MQDGRKFTRRRTSDYLTVTDGKSGQVVGRVIDMSPKGVMIMSADAMKVGCSIQLEIALLTRIFDADRLTLTGECRWSNFNKRSDLWKNGVEISEISAENRKLLQQVVLRLMTHNGECGEAGGHKWGKSKEKLELVRVRRYSR